MAKETLVQYDMSEAPKYIQWERGNRKTIYFEPLICKQENELDSQAYLAMYARCYSRNGVRRYRMDEYLFRVEGPTLAETLLCFGQRLSDLQAAEIIQGRYLCADKVETSHRMLLQENLFNKLRELHYKTRK